MRNIKSEDEINKIRKAAELADKCIEIGVSYLKEGVTEREVVNHIEQTIKQYGVNEMSFDTMVYLEIMPHHLMAHQEIAD